MSMATAPDYYEVLQVSPNAEAEVIQAAYRRLAMKWHPDRNPGDSLAASQMKLLNEAYGVLSDSTKRREYDLRHQYCETSENAKGKSTPASRDATRSEPTAAPLSDEMFKPESGKYKSSDVLLFAIIALVAAGVGWGVLKPAPAPVPAPAPTPASPSKPIPISSTQSEKLLDLSNLPEVRFTPKSDDSGRIRGTVHNGVAQSPIKMLKLSIKTATWERVYEVQVFVKYGTTAHFIVYIGDPSVDVMSINILAASL
jgi:curved DNA-binding protein CbpA